MMGLEVGSLSAIIAALSGVLSVALTVWVMWRVNHVVTLTNSNYEALQETLDTSLERNAVLEGEAAEERSSRP